MIKRQQTHKDEADLEDFTRKVLMEDELTRVKSRGSSARAKKELQAIEKTMAESQSFLRLLEDDTVQTSEGSE